MIGINMPMPKRCFDCPLSYWVQSGYFEGMLMCNAKEANLARNKDYSDELIGECIVDEFKEERPKDCPIMDGEFPKFCRYCGKQVF
jgi:hypothetical protein